MSKLATAKKICREMLLLRNYKEEEETDDKIVFLRPDNKQVYVYFSTSNNGKLNIQGIKEYIEDAEISLITNCIIIYTNSITASAKKVISNLIHMNIELFDQQDLQFNITKHRLARPHIKLDEVEKLKFISDYGKDIPVLLKNDMMCRFYGFQKGDIIRVIRKDNYISYRIVK